MLLGVKVGTALSVAPVDMGADAIAVARARLGWTSQWAASVPIGVASGRTGVRAKAALASVK
jgi:hypothetical protein